MGWCMFSDQKNIKGRHNWIRNVVLFVLTRTMKKITSDIGFTADRGAMIHVFLLCMPSWIDRMGFSLPRPHFQPKSRPGDDKTTDGGNLIAVHHGQVNPFEHFHLYFLFVIFVKDSRHLYIYLLNFLDCRFSFHHFLYHPYICI